LVELAIDLVVKNCKLVTSTEIFDAGIGVDEGRIAVIAKDSTLPQADKVIDAEGNYLLPGVIDTHVHFRDPGTTSYKEDWTTGSNAAAAGGVTTVFDMPGSADHAALVKNATVLNEKIAVATKKSIVDFGVYGLVQEGNLAELVPMAKAGAIGYKTMLGVSASKTPVINDGTFMASLEIIAGTGLRSALHCEDQDLLGYYAEKLKGRNDPLLHAEARPNVCEAEAVSRAIVFSRATGAKVHVVHASAKETVELVRDAKAKGIQISMETCPHYLVLTNDDAKHIGSVLKMNPPVRSKEDADSLWEGIKDGTVDNIATDHSPHAPNEKIKENFWEVTPGFCGVETQVPLMLTQVNEGRLPITRYVQLSSEAPAKLFGIYPRKGALQVGSDGDLTIVDMKKESQIKSEKLHSKTKMTPFDGMKVKGMPIYTIVRGNVVMDHGQLVSKPIGQVIKPTAG
jgi:dihydroorotase